MSIALTAARAALLLFSLLGYVHAAGKKLRAEFALGAVLVSIGSVMFLAGILNILQAAAWALCLGGVLLALLALRRRESFRWLFRPGLAFLAICAVFYFYILFGVSVTEYDNFSHWAVVTRIMLQSDRFPVAADPNVIFQSYPLGSASFVYYGAYILGVHAEWMQTFLQAMLTAALLAGLFAFAKRRGTVLLTAVVAVLILASGLGAPDSLLVDKLLSCTALGAVLLCCFYQDELQEKIWWTVPYLVFLTAIKNSGLLFAAMTLLYALVLIRKERRFVLSWTGCALSPVLTLVLWQQHVKHTFASGLTAKHSMSLQNFSMVFGDKTPEDIHTILSGYIRAVFDLSNPFLYLLVFLAALYLLMGRTGAGDRRRARRSAVFVLLSYAAYMIGMFAMYLFTMPTYEALELASYDRYHMTVLAVLCGVVLTETVTALDSLPPRVPAFAAGVLLAAVSFFALSPVLSNLQKRDLSGTWREMMDTAIEEYDVRPEGSYVLLVNDTAAANNNGCFYYMIRYLLDPAIYVFEDAETLQQKPFILEAFDYDYLIALDDTEDIRSYMADAFGDPDLRVVDLSDGG